MIHWDISPLILCKPKKLVSAPRFIRVNDFDEGAVAKFRSEIDAAVSAGQPILPILIDSYGGDAYAMMAMVDILDGVRPSTTIVTVAEGKAMSAGAVLLMCGDRGMRFVSPNATVMVHEGWDVASGKVEEVKASTENLVRLEESCYALMDKHGRKKPGFYKKLIHDRAHADWYLSPDDCLKYGLADNIGVPDLAISVGVEYSILVPTDPSKPGPKKAGRRKSRKGGSK